MPLNAEVAARLQEIADLLELTGADSYRAAANSRAARAVADHPTDLASMIDEKGALEAIPGVGTKIAEKIREYATTGSMMELDELRALVPPGVPPLLRIPGLGPKTLRAIWQTLGVTDEASLRRALDDGSILRTPRMGEKTAANIRSALEFTALSAGRVRLGEAWALGEAVSQRLRRVPGVVEAQTAGSLRRGCDTVRDIDIVVSAPLDAGAKAAALFSAMPEVRQVLVAGATKTSVRASLGAHTGQERLIQIDLRVVEPGCFGAALLYFTGSKEHNIRLRHRALARGMTLNEYGLFPDDGAVAAPQERGVQPLAAATEEEVYRALGLPWIPPELREDHAETDVPAGHDFGLLGAGDIRAELHAHTTASDGSMSIVQLARRAKERGFHTIAVTDHSKSQPIANGLSPERLRAHIAEVHLARREVSGITILAGSEVDILADGSLDYADDLLAMLDIVVASPHASLKQDRDAATARLIRAATHPLVNIIGHPTGRLINEREGLSPDIRAVAAAAAANGVALEINANSWRLDLRDAHAREALACGALLTIDCDVHGEGDFDQLRFGVATARRAGLTPDRCPNAWAEDRLHAWLRRKRRPPAE